MKIVLAPDSFKESLSAIDVCRAMEKGLRSVDATMNILSLPLADGGEGTVETMVAAVGGKIHKHKVTGPLLQPVTAEYGILADQQTVVIEMASASGLMLVPPDKRNPLHTTTFGTGELIRTVLDQGYRKIIIGIGGSATNDGGAGMAQALGAEFYDSNHNKLDILTGGTLAQVAGFDFTKLHPALQHADIKVACDVDNPLLGERGAVAVYSAQKGSTAETRPVLENGLHSFYSVIEKMQFAEMPGAGAAGGLGAGLMAFCNAALTQGIDLVLSTCRFTEHIQDAEYIITGEGQIDEQSAMGKTIHGVLKRAGNVPVIAIGGSIAESAQQLYKHGILAYFSICPAPISLEQAMQDAAKNIEQTLKNIARLLLYRT